MRKTRIVLAIVAAYLILILFGHLPDHLILFPTKAPIDAGEAARKMVPFQNDELEVWTAKSYRAKQQADADIYVLRFYGNADRADRWVAAEAEGWNGRAVEIWGMNYPGFGGSTGPARLSRIAPAALTAFDELKRVANDRPIVLFAASICSLPTLHVSAHRNVTGLILSTPPYTREFI